MNNYFELRIKINPDITDIVTDMFFDVFDCEGIVTTEESYKDLEMTNSTEGTLRIFIKGDSRPDFKNIIQEQKDILKSRGLTDEELGSWEYSIEEKENQDWSEKWKEKWTVTHATDKVTIVPSWLEYTPKLEEEIIINIDPGCAFGTGTHQTTQLCMRALEKYFKQGMSMADIGTGSGILAIMAKKMGASNIYGCDIEDDVIETARKNANINGLDKLQPFNENTDFQVNTADNITEQFDFVCANILHNVLAEIMPDLKRIMKDSAYLSLSGILDEKRQIVLDAVMKNNLKVVDEIHQNQWVSFVVIKDN